MPAVSSDIDVFLRSANKTEARASLAIADTEFNAADYGTPMAWYSARRQAAIAEDGWVARMTDFSGNGNDAIVTGSNYPLYQAKGGLPGASFNFSLTGTNSSMTLPDTVSVSSRDFTIIFGLRCASLSAQQTWISLGRTGAGTGAVNFYQTSGLLTVYPSAGGGGASTGYLESNFITVAITGSAAALTWYMPNGTNAASALTAATLTGGKIGEAYTGASYMQAELVECAIYDTALTATEIGKARARLESIYSKPGTTWGTLLAVVGESISRGYGTNNNPWPRMVAERLGGHVKLLTCAGDGVTLSGAMSPDPYYVTNYARKICVVFIGTNDLDNGTAGATLESSLNTFCAARRTTGWQVVLINCLPRAVQGSWSADNETQRLAYNAAIAANWASYADAYIDAAGDARLSTVNGTWYSDSVTHLNAGGASVIAEKVEKAIRALY